MVSEEKIWWNSTKESAERIYEWGRSIVESSFKRVDKDRLRWEMKKSREKSEARGNKAMWSKSKPCDVCGRIKYFLVDEGTRRQVAEAPKHICWYCWKYSKKW